MSMDGYGEDEETEGQIVTTLHRMTLQYESLYDCTG